MKILCSLHQNVNDTKILILKFKIITSGISKCIKSALLIRLFIAFAYVFEKRQFFYDPRCKFSTKDSEIRAHSIYFNINKLHSFLKKHCSSRNYGEHYYDD